VRVFRLLCFNAVFLLPLGYSDVRGCVCDAARPETMAAQECDLCRAVDREPPGPEFLTIHDASPNKPNRWLAVPRFHGRNPQDLAGMTAEQRTAYWTVAIAKAKELWGGSWGLAVNSLATRTQCHAHIHIGKLKEGVENSRFLAVDSPAEIPLPREGDGIWVHPVGGHLHVHWGDDSPELLLER
jgi:diadenosine tetraphosphate (Ap4A) HIT family hydrolase